MKFMPEKGFKSNDIVYTPPRLAADFVRHFNPQGKGLDPARGGGAFYNAFTTDKDWCEIAEGRDFFTYTEKVDYIMTNPPWSLMRRFLNHSYEIADNVYFLVTLGHCFTHARLTDAKNAGFGIKELCCCKTPKDGVWPTTGLQLGMCHWKRGWRGDIRLTELEETTNQMELKI